MQVGSVSEIDDLVRAFKVILSLPEKTERERETKREIINAIRTKFPDGAYKSTIEVCIRNDIDCQCSVEKALSLAKNARKAAKLRNIDWQAFEKTLLVH